MCFLMMILIKPPKQVNISQSLNQHIQERLLFALNKIRN